jgi:hypothetical protein
MLMCSVVSQRFHSDESNRDIIFYNSAVYTDDTLVSILVCEINNHAETLFSKTVN